MRVALHVLPRILAAGKLSNLGEVIDPVPSPVLLSQLLDRLGAVLVDRHASFRLTHWDEVKRLDALLGAPGLLEAVRAEAARLAAKQPPERADAARKVGILEAEMASAAAAARAAPRQSSASGGGGGGAGGGGGGSVETLVQGVYDVSHTCHRPSGCLRGCALRSAGSGCTSWMSWRPRQVGRSLTRIASYPT